MQSVHAQFSLVPGTQAAVGWSGKHCIIADRPEGTAGGMGLGFNGAEMLSLALGACFSNDLHYLADQRGQKIEDLVIQVALQLNGDPIMAVAADIRVKCRMQDGTDGSALIEEARARSMVINSLARGVPVSVAVSE